MTTPRTEPRDVSALSDRAFRLFFQLSLYSPGEWVAAPHLAIGLNVPPHAIRMALAELCAAGMAERDRRYLRPRGQRPTTRTYFRLTDDTPSEASA